MPVAFVADYSFWLWWFGHNLSPWGAFTVKPFMPTVFGEGKAKARLVAVGEQPGDKEDLAGEPFVGPAGKLLDRALEEAGIAPESVFRTNVVKHFRFAGTRGKQRIHKSPSRVHVAACGPWLVAELALVRPRGVVVLGGTAGKALFVADFPLGKAASFRRAGIPLRDSTGRR